METYWIAWIPEMSFFLYEVCEGSEGNGAAIFPSLCPEFYDPVKKGLGEAEYERIRNIDMHTTGRTTCKDVGLSDTGFDLLSHYLAEVALKTLISQVDAIGDHGLIIIQDVDGKERKEDIAYLACKTLTGGDYLDQPPSYEQFTIDGSRSYDINIRNIASMRAKIRGANERDHIT